MSFWRIVRESLALRELGKTPYGWAPAAVFAALFFSGAFGNRVLIVAGPNIAQDLNLDLRTVGGIQSIVSILGIISLLLIAWLADRVRRKRLAGIGMIVAGGAGMVRSAATNMRTFASADVFSTVSENFAAVPIFSLLADYYPVKNRGRVFGLISISRGIGALLSVLVVGVMVTVLGWRTTNVITSAPLILLGVVALLVFREPVRGYFEKLERGFDEETARRADPPQSFGEGWRTVWSVRLVRRLFVGQIFYGIGFAPFNVYLSFMLADEYGLNPIQRSLFALPVVISGVFGGVLGGGLIDVLGARSPSSVLRVLAASSLIPVTGLILLATTPPLWLAVIGVVLFTMGNTVVQPTFLSINSQVIPAQVRSMGQMMIYLADVPAAILLGILFGPVVDLYGYGPMLALCVPFILVNAVIMASAADFFEGDRRNAILATAANEEARQAAEQGRSKMLVCRGVNVFYEGNQVLFGVDLDIDEGDIVALLGTNGAGKSTLLRAISGSHEASDGAIIFEGREITHMPPHEIVGRGVVHMPGGRGIFPGLTVEENLKLATWLEESEARRLLSDAYELFPVLYERRGEHAGILSGGEQQMLSLAQSFMIRPKLLMIDELTLGLSPAIVGELIEKVAEINRRGTTVVVVEQSVNVALTIAKKAVFMEKGEVKFVGSTSDLVRRPDILRAVYVKGTGALRGTETAVSRAQQKQRDLELSDARVVLDARQIEKSYGGVTALSGVSLSLREGEILGIIGPNGSGKTTLFDVISGYQIPNGGQVIYDDIDVTNMTAHERARIGLVRRFQDARIFPSLTVTEALLVALDQRMEARSLATATAGFPASRRAERKARRQVEGLIELLQLGAFKDKFVKELSTGLRRIVDIAWVLATQPKVLLLDEPSSGVAQAEAESLGPLLRRVRFETGCSILLIEHDIPLISGIADELVAMAEGLVLLRGSAEEVMNDERVIESFLGTSEAAVKRSGVLA